MQLLVVQHGHLTINDYKDLSGDVIKIEGYTTNIQHISNMIVSNGGTLMGCPQQVHNWEINILHQNVDKLHKSKKLQLSHADYLQPNMEPNKWLCSIVFLRYKWRDMRTSQGYTIHNISQYLAGCHQAPSMPLKVFPEHSRSSTQTWRCLCAARFTRPKAVCNSKLRFPKIRVHPNHPCQLDFPL